MHFVTTLHFSTLSLSECVLLHMRSYTLTYKCVCVDLSSWCNEARLKKNSKNKIGSAEFNIMIKK